MSSLDPQPRRPGEGRIAAAQRVDAIGILLLGKLAAHVPLAQPLDLVLVQVPDVIAHELRIRPRRRLDAVPPQRREDVRTIRESHVGRSVSLYTRGVSPSGALEPLPATHRFG